MVALQLRVCPPRADAGGGADAAQGLGPRTPMQAVVPTQLRVCGPARRCRRWCAWTATRATRSRSASWCGRACSLGCGGRPRCWTRTTCRAGACCRRARSPVRARPASWPCRGDPLRPAVPRRHARLQAGLRASTMPQAPGRRLPGPLCSGLLKLRPAGPRARSAGPGGGARKHPARVRPALRPRAHRPARGGPNCCGGRRGAPPPLPLTHRRRCNPWLQQLRAVGV